MVYLLILLINNDFSELENIFSGVEVYVCIGLAFISLEAMRFTLSVSEKWLSKQSIRRRITVQLLATLSVSLTLVALAIWAYYIWIVGFAISTNELSVFLAIYGSIGLLYNVVLQ
jgi:hypothetical protein